MLHAIHKHKAACGSVRRRENYGVPLIQVGLNCWGVGGALQYCTFEREPVDGVESTGLQTYWRGKQ